MSFRIDWYVPMDEWHALHREQDNPDYDNEVMARIDLLDGEIQLLADHHALFPLNLLQGRRGVVVSVIDLAYQLAPIVHEFERNAVDKGSSALFSAVDSFLEIFFTWTDSGIEITSSACREQDNCRILTTEVEFRDGVHDFLRDVMGQIRTWAPHALRWPVFSGLKQYLNDDNPAG